MGGVVKVRVEGLRELGERFKRLKVDMQDKAAWAATSRGASIVKTAAKATIRRQSWETGTLFKAVVMKRAPKGQRQTTAEHWVTVRRRRTGKKVSKKSRTVQETAPHAGFLEFGTVKMQAEPYLGPALKDNIGTVTEAMRKSLAKSIAKYSK